MALKDEWSTAAAAAGAADPSKRRLPARKPHAAEGRQRLLLLLLCSQRHGPPGRGNTMALKDERNPKYAFPEAGTSLLKLLLCPQRHGPPGRGNTMALKDEWSPKWTFPGAGTSLLKSPRKKKFAFLDAGYWELLLLLLLLLLLVQLTLQKGGFRQGNPYATEGRQRLLLLLCPQRHGPPGRGNTMALKDERSPK